MAKLSAFLIFVLASLSLFAQNEKLNPNDRQRWLAEMREYKHEFLTKELNLTKEQQKEFFTLYDDMEDDIERINVETRQLENRLEKNNDASDLELENGARTIFEQKRAEGQIEMTYFEKFQQILTPRQLAKLKVAERRWNQQLVNHHRRMAGHRHKAEKH